jgi:hypothetical protein
MKMSYWKAALSEKVLGDPGLPARLLAFDKTALSADKMMEVEEVLS